MNIKITPLIILCTFMGIFIFIFIKINSCYKKTILSQNKVYEKITLNTNNNRVGIKLEKVIE